METACDMSSQRTLYCEKNDSGRCSCDRVYELRCFKEPTLVLRRKFLAKGPLSASTLDQCWRCPNENYPRNCLPTYSRLRRWIRKRLDGERVQLKEVLVPRPAQGVRVSISKMHFSKMHFWKCIFWKCIFRKCIFENTIIYTVLSVFL